MTQQHPAGLPGVDIAELAALVANLIAPPAEPPADVEAIAQRCADVVLQTLTPLVQRIEAATARNRTIGPYVPRPDTNTN